jgi:polyisoprenoid-binding protein YceI
MSQTARIIVGLIVLGLVVAIIVFIYIWVSGGSGAPSATLSAPTLAIATRAPTIEATTAPTSEPTAEATTEATEAATSEATAEASAEATSESVQALAATDEATAEATTEATAAVEASAAELVIFNIVTDDSEVRFVLNEILRGSPNTVTGRTDQIAGQIAVDFANPQNSQVGEIRISARSLATDNELRNRAIRGQILQSSQDEFEFINFKPTAITGLPDSVTIGEPFEFQITGDLTIRDVTNPVTFVVTVTPESETRIEGTATATVQRGDYNLIIPNVPGVADVDEAVVLEVDFAAEAQS